MNKATLLPQVALIAIAILCSACEFSKDLNVDNIKGYEFSLHDIQEHCTVKREGDRHLAISCARENMKAIIRGCEGQMTEGLSDPRFYCSGGLWALNKVCRIEMLNTQEGNIKCKKG